MNDLLELKPVRSEPGRPLYEAVRDAVRAAIDTGRVGPGEQLPSTKAISESMQVSLVTVHRALQDLVGSGVLRRGQGRGTFVHEDYFQPDRKATNTRFGLVFHAESSLADFYHGQLLEGIRRHGLTLGVDLVILRYGEDWRNECQGYLYINPFLSQLDRSPRYGVSSDPDGGRGAAPPTMVVGARCDRPGVSFADTDNVGLARRAVEHLASLGHRRLLYVGGDRDLSNSVDRLRGFQEACEAIGIECEDDALLICNDWKLDTGALERLTERLMQPDRPTGVFATGYYLALDTYKAAERAGLEIPNDLSVVGVDDPPSALHLSPSLTTMRQPLMEMGRAAVQEVHDQATSGRRRAAQITLDAELVARDSTGPAPTPQPMTRAPGPEGVKR